MGHRKHALVTRRINAEIRSQQFFSIALAAMPATLVAATYAGQYEAAAA